jgi:hypothetical protein
MRQVQALGRLNLALPHDKEETKETAILLCRFPDK